MEKPIRILLLEDMEADSLLVDLELKRQEIAYETKRVWTKDDFLRELKEFKPDVVISDYNLPQFDGLAAFRLFKENHFDTIPFILYTGAQNDEFAVECLKEGMDDYVLKKSGSMARLPMAIQSAMKKKQLEQEQNQCVSSVEKKLQELKSNFTKDLTTSLKKEWEGKIVALMKEVDHLLQMLGKPKKYGQSERI